MAEARSARPAPRPRGGNKVEFWSGKILYPVIVVLLVLTGFFAMAILPRMLDRGHPMVGKAAPTFALPVLPGTVVPKTDGTVTPPIDLAALKGKVVVLDFWAPWCAPCRAEMPELDKVATKLSAEGVAFVGVMVDGDPDDARDFVRGQHIGYPQARDEAGTAASAYKVQTLPSLVVVDRNGVVRAYHVGTWDGDDVEAAVRAAM
ncbi:MAG: hypothetical protein NVSMB47_22090 [Polyangiales bacterium]